MPIRFLFTLIVLLGLPTQVLAEVSATVQENAEVQQQDSQRPTLQDLKTTGALQSTFRTRQARPLNNGVAPTANLASFKKEIQPILAKACADCHGADTQEGNIRIDTLNPDLFLGDDVDWWLEVLAVLNNGEMPPPDEGELSDADRNKVIEWLSSEIQVASAVRRAEGGHSSFRRMTRYEYKYALQDLLGAPLDFAKDLPPDPISEDGFENSSETLHMSVSQLDTYRESARKALALVVAPSEKPQAVYWGVSMKTAWDKSMIRHENELKKIRKEHKDNEEKRTKELERKKSELEKRPNNAYYANLDTNQFRRAEWRYHGATYAWDPSADKPKIPAASNHFAVIPRNQTLIVELGDQVPDRGTLRVRVRAKRESLESDNPGDPSLQLEFGWQASNDSRAAVRISPHDIAIDSDELKFYQWEVPLSDIYPRNGVRHISKMGDLPSPSEQIKLVNRSVSQGDIYVDYVEVTAPVYEIWPPASHTKIFFDSENKSKEPKYAKEILTSFMTRAWRRDVDPSEVEQKLILFKKMRPACDTFEEAIVEVLSTVLSSPRFLYLANRSANSLPATQDKPESNPPQADSLSQDELATRLSMFLWCSTPDDTLLELASQGTLGDDEVLLAQVDRLLDDPRSRRFSERFVRQWLGMQLLDYLDVDRKAYRQFDDSLKEAMQEEPIAFFHEVLTKDHTVVDFVHADYTLANERLAKHYGIPDVLGNEFRRVALPPESRRGGLLTQAGLLAMNSDGVDSHPLKRGIWLLESLLNDPPPPPPPAVPEIDLADPEIAKMTLKERIEDHRNQPACMSCHAKIDPWGIAFENFDAIGSWRTTIKDKPVDATSQLFNGQPLDGMDGLKRFLLEKRQDQFVRALVHKMTTYALGRPLTFSDRSSVDQITAEVRKRDDGLATMVQQIVASDLFRMK